MRLLFLVGAALAAVVATPSIGHTYANELDAQAKNEQGIRHIFGLRTSLSDGVELSSDVWLPDTLGPHPVILIRTPYVKSLGGFAKDAIFFARRGYAVVVQDVRGRGDSGGEFDFVFQEAKDGYEVIEAIAAQPWSNGKLCMMGVSYMGTVQWQAARKHPSHLSCLVSISPAARFMDELPSLGGAFGMQWSLFWLNAVSDRGVQRMNGAALDWSAIFQHRPLRTADEAMGRKMRLYREFLKHDHLDGYWKRLYLSPQEYQGIDIPILAITGLFDTNQTGALFTWSNVERYAPQARDRRYLVIGPWTHDQADSGGVNPVGDMRFPASAAIDNRDMALRFLNRYLRDDATAFDQGRVRVFLTGADEWLSFNRYPLDDTTTTSFYLDSEGRANTAVRDGVLTKDHPLNEVVDRYRFDPLNPIVQSLESSASDIGQGRDRSAIQAREDVLVYTTSALERSLEVIGSVEVELFVASDAFDTDFTASLTDVGPDGRALSLGPLPFGILRTRYRRGLDRSVLLTPGKPEKITISLGDIAHRFRQGHRIRLEISSSAFPIINPNQNTGTNVADDMEWKVAHQKILHGPRYPSRLVLPIWTRPCAGTARLDSVAASGSPGSSKQLATEMSLDKAVLQSCLP